MSSRALLASAVALVLITTLATTLVIELARDDVSPFERKLTTLEERLGTLEETLKERSVELDETSERALANDVHTRKLRAELEALTRDVDYLAGCVERNQICVLVP